MLFQQGVWWLAQHWFCAQKNVFKIIFEDISFLLDHWYPYFGLLVASPMSFRARVDPLACMFHHLHKTWSSKSHLQTSWRTGMAAVLFSSTYLLRTYILTAFHPWFRISSFCCCVLSADHRLRNHAPGFTPTTHAGHLSLPQHASRHCVYGNFNCCDSDTEQSQQDEGMYPVSIIYKQESIPVGCVHVK